MITRSTNCTNVLQPIIWLSFMDDIFIIWTHDKSKVTYLDPLPNREKSNLTFQKLINYQTQLSKYIKIGNYITLYKTN